MEIWKNNYDSLLEGMARAERGYTCYARAGPEETASTNGVNVYRVMAFKRRGVCGEAIFGLRVA